MAVFYCEKCGHNVKAPHTKCPNADRQVLWAFWSYDLCPYVIGGMVEKFLEDGYVRARNYAGMKFKPIAIIPDEAGRKALNALSELRAEYSEAEKALKKTYANKVRKLIGLQEEA